MLKKILKNNLIAVAAYVCAFIISIIAYLLMWHFGVWWGAIEMRDIIYGIATVSFHTIVIFSLIFCAGRKFLKNTDNTLANIFSVIAIPVIIIVALFISAAWPDRARANIGLLLLPIMPISETIWHFSHISLEGVFLIMSPLPPLAMWAGMITKKVCKQ